MPLIPPNRGRLARRRLTIGLLLLGLAGPAGPLHADPVTAAAAIRQRVLANRPLKDYALKARLFPTRDQTVPVEILVKHSATAWQTLYRAGTTELLVIQPTTGPEQLFLRGTGELRGPQRLGKLLGSQFTYYDLGIPFLYWPASKLVGEGRVRGRDCYELDSRADGEPYARVRLWIDKQYFALLRAEAFDANDTLRKRFVVTSFKKIGGAWVPRGLEVATLPPGQSLPAEEKSRLEVFEGTEDAVLPAAWFQPGNFQ